MTRSLLLIAAALLTGCPPIDSADSDDSAGTDSDPHESAPPCDLLPLDTTFYSVDELECGLSPHGVSYCHWQITFYEAGYYNWMYSDVGEDGDWTCDLDTITGAWAVGTYDPASGILTWDGVDYTASSGG